MNFKQFLEAKKLLNSNQKPININGWNVYFSGDSEDLKSKAIKDIDIATKRLIAIGISKTIKVPIIIYIKNELDKQNGLEYLGKASAGKYRRLPGQIEMNKGNTTHSIKLYISKNVSDKEIIRTFIHEVGHIIYSSLDKNDQTEIMNMANKIKSPTEYGNVDFKYDKNSKPEYNHTSGNEWFAEMLAEVIINPEYGKNKGFVSKIKSLLGMENKYNPRDISKVKNLIYKARISPHGGISYKNVQ